MGEVLVGEVLVSPPEKLSQGLRSGGQRCVEPAAARVLPGHRPTRVLLSEERPRRGQGLRAQADASSWDPAACPELPISNCSRNVGGGAFLTVGR